MSKNIFLVSSAIQNRVAIEEILKCNDYTQKYSLTLTPEEAKELVEVRSHSLRQTDRVEFGGGIIDKLILKFCDSPFLSKHNYAQFLNDLIETFYYFKNESLDNLSDDELLTLMKEYFDRNCKGSIELLQGRELELLARNIRCDTFDFKSLKALDEVERGEEDFEE